MYLEPHLQVYGAIYMIFIYKMVQLFLKSAFWSIHFCD